MIVKLEKIENSEDLFLPLTQEQCNYLDIKEGDELSIDLDADSGSIKLMVDRREDLPYNKAQNAFKYFSSLSTGLLSEKFNEFFEVIIHDWEITDEAQYVESYVDRLAMNYPENLRQMYNSLLGKTPFSYMVYPSTLQKIRAACAVHVAFNNIKI